MRSFPLFMMWASGVGIGSILETGVEGPQTAGMVLGVAVCTVAGIVAARSKGKTDDVWTSFEQEAEAEIIRRETPPFKKWSGVASLLNHHFRLARAFGGGVTYNNDGCVAMYDVIKTMGDTLDKAVDKAWAELPDAELIERARNLEATPAAQKDMS